MTMASTLRTYLDEHGIDYELVSHPHSESSMRTAALAHVPGHQLAKSVLLEDEDGYLLVVLPSTRRVRLGLLHKQLERPLGLATEPELGALFPDCETGAIPPVGEAYGIPTLLDDSLRGCAEIYFEAGDHNALVRLSGREFQRMMEGLPHGRFSRHI
jgi:Ala-tRNA(Pro) deacylase